VLAGKLLVNYGYNRSRVYLMDNIGNWEENEFRRTETDVNGLSGDTINLHFFSKSI
jgi:hypothetical protein